MIEIRLLVHSIVLDCASALMLNYPAMKFELATEVWKFRGSHGTPRVPKSNYSSGSRTLHRDEGIPQSSLKAWADVKRWET